MTKPYWSEGLEPIVRPELYAMKNRLLYVGMLCAVLSAGCFEMFHQTTTNPTPTVQLLMEGRAFARMSRSPSRDVDSNNPV